MSYDLIYYWENFLDKYIDKGIQAKKDSYILRFYIINQASKETFYKWFSFSNKEGLLGFIKFIALPSAYCSKAFGEKGRSVLITAAIYEDVLELLENSKLRVTKDIIDNFKKDYEKIEEIESNQKFDLEMLSMFCKGFGYPLDHNSKVFSDIKVYENIKEFGKELIDRFKQGNKIERLEEQLNMNIHEIENMFLNAENNPFMLKRINTFLDSKFIL